jgi:tellurite resistance protein
MTTSTPWLGLKQVQAMVRGMYDLARVDGVHASEMIMLRGFYEQCQRDAQALTTFEELIAVPFDLVAAKDALDTPDRKTAFIQSCLLLAHADGNYTQNEQAHIKKFAQALGVANETFMQLEAQVADTLLQQFAAVSNVEALQQVVRETQVR